MSDIHRKRLEWLRNRLETLRNKNPGNPQREQVIEDLDNIVTEIIEIHDYQNELARRVDDNDESYYISPLSTRSLKLALARMEYLNERYKVNSRIILGDEDAPEILPETRGILKEIIQERESEQY